MRKFRDVLSCNSSACSATTSLISRAWRRNSCSSSLVAAHAVSPSAASCRFLELLRPAVIKTFRNPLATAQLRYGVLATQPHKQDADFLLCAIPLDASARSARFYDLLSNAPVKLNVAERRAFPDDLPVDDVIGVGWGGYAPLPMPR
jgi:hypothetical protein